MFLIIGTVVVLASVFGGYIGQGGHMEVLWQPFELLIIMGAAVAFNAGDSAWPKSTYGMTREALALWLVSSLRLFLLGFPGVSDELPSAPCRRAGWKR